MAARAKSLVPDAKGLFDLGASACGVPEAAAEYSSVGMFSLFGTRMPGMLTALGSEDTEVWEFTKANTHTYIYIYTCICICIYIYVCVHLHIHTHIHIHIDTHIYIYAYTNIHCCTYLYTYTDTSTCLYPDVPKP